MGSTHSTPAPPPPPPPPPAYHGPSFEQATPETLGETLTRLYAYCTTLPPGRRAATVYFLGPRKSGKSSLASTILRIIRNQEHDWFREFFVAVMSGGGHSDYRSVEAGTTMEMSRVGGTDMDTCVFRFFDLPHIPFGPDPSFPGRESRTMDDFTKQVITVFLKGTRSGTTVEEVRDYLTRQESATGAATSPGSPCASPVGPEEPDFFVAENAADCVVVVADSEQWMNNANETYQDQIRSLTQFVKVTASTRGTRMKWILVGTKLDLVAGPTSAIPRTEAEVRSSLRELVDQVVLVTSYHHTSEHGSTCPRSPAIDRSFLEILCQLKAFLIDTQ